MQSTRGKGWSRTEQRGLSQHTDELILVQKTSVQTATLHLFLEGGRKPVHKAPIDLSETSQDDRS